MEWRTEKPKLLCMVEFLSTVGCARALFTSTYGYTQKSLGCRVTNDFSKSSRSYRDGLDFSGTLFSIRKTSRLSLDPRAAVPTHPVEE